MLKHTSKASIPASNAVQMSKTGMPIDPHIGLMILRNRNETNSQPSNHVIREPILMDFSWHFLEVQKDPHA